MPKRAGGVLGPVPDLLLHFDDEAALAASLAAALGVATAAVARHRFPDGECRLTMPASLPEHVVLLRGLHVPNEKLAMLMLLAPALREAGVRRLVLVAPYLAYMRQDIAFHPGEVVSQRQVGRALAAWFDGVVTIDPHLHRVASMHEVISGRPAAAPSAAQAIGAYVAQRVPEALLLGPDEESARWVGAAAAQAGLAHGVCRKVRRGDLDVDVALPPDLDLRDRAVVLVDDVASTGRTLAVAARAALAAGASHVDVAVTHALFVGDALAELEVAGVRHVWSSDSVPHESNVIPTAPLLADAIRTLS